MILRGGWRGYYVIYSYNTEIAALPRVDRNDTIMWHLVAAGFSLRSVSSVYLKSPFVKL